MSKNLSTWFMDDPIVCEDTFLLSYICLKMSGKAKWTNLSGIFRRVYFSTKNEP